MPGQCPGLEPTMFVELTEVSHRLLNDAPPDAHAAHKAPRAVNLSVLLANRMAQIHAPSQSPPKQKRNNQGRHYTLKPRLRANQPFDPTHSTSRKIAKTTPELLKLG